MVALSPEAAMQLQATLDKNGEAEVGGYWIVAGMISASMVERPMSNPNPNPNPNHGREANV